MKRDVEMKEIVNSTMFSERNHQISPGNSDEIYGKYLTFWTGDQFFGIPIADVVQIVGIQKITQVPALPECAKGVIDLRGIIIPIISVRLRLHKE